MEKEIICGKSFEDLSNDEMVEIEGGWACTFVCTTLPCGIGASVSAIAVSIYYKVK
ncbi:MAG: hypothetical protein II838_06570 [Lachnospiraceae bacterium]|nr:hypothetical protein [Lachnospiraceae bacterium]